ncbi:hypothetical protein RCH20_002545 [Psychrobacter sp. PL15]|uniref:hypothetical protein n=1 Tax=Psychrobacter sp. PL15 TaxID=3071719 RepID=UPI002DFFF927|nr:hypothetical protein [Psychrobacter sp. PL15]
MSKPTLTELDSSFYPQVWEQQVFKDPQALLIAILEGRITSDPKAFTKQILANDAYQQWINFTVFGRYIQRSFAAFYQQSEDSFNMDIPALFRHELMRHAQYLPLDQILFVAGDIPKKVRREKLLTTTLNPATAVNGARTSKQHANKAILANTQETVVNQIRVAGKQVLGFAIRHNKRTSERTRNEVLILDFQDLRLVNEQSVEQSNTAISKGTVINDTIINGTAIQHAAIKSTATLLRCYELR